MITMPDLTPAITGNIRVRFAPSPTGFLHVGSARTFIFNWLYARHNQGTMVLRLDDTDVERNTDASVQSIFEGLRWLGLSWDEEYKQSERLALHRQAAESIFAKGLAYRDFTPAHASEGEQSSAQGAWLFNPGMREMSREESDRRATSGEPFALRYRVPRNTDRTLSFKDSVYGHQSKLADEVEDFRPALRSDWYARPITLPPASTMPISASATSSAARITSPTPSSTCSSSRALVLNLLSSHIFLCLSRQTAPSSPSASTGPW